MTQLEGIFLDFYGTLAGGDRAAVVNICRQVITDHGLPLTADELAVAWGRRYFAAIESINGDNFRALVQIEEETLVETAFELGRTIDAVGYIQALNDYLAAPPLFEEVREVIAALKLPVCIVSNADDRELSKALAHHGLQFNHVVTSERARSYKPESGIFSLALKLTGWSAARVLHVGDSLHSDVAGARRVGIQTAWVNRGERISDIGTEQPDVTWSDLRPLTLL